MTTKLTPSVSKTSFRQRYRSPQGPPVVDDAPQRVRAGFVYIVAGFKIELITGLAALPGWPAWPKKFWEHLYQQLEEALKVPRNHLIFDYERALEGHLLTCDWFQLYESVEFFSQLITTNFSKRDSAGFRRKINQLFAEENIGYRVDDRGEVVAASSPEFIAAGQAAMAATDRAELSHVHAQLSNAFRQLTLRQLDPANAVKEAVGALQGVLRARLGKAKGQISVAEMSAALKADLHPALAGSIDALVKIEGFRGDAAAHDQKAGREVTVEEAIFVAHQCSAATALIATKMRL